MSKFLFKMERKFGRYAVPNLTTMIIICYVIGYVVSFIAPEITQYITINPYYILHGQVWRLISWVLIPPGALSIWTLFILLFYYSIGRSLESVWGDFRYNVFVFSGIIFTILGAFLIYGFAYVQFAEELKAGLFTAKDIFSNGGYDVGGQRVLLPGGWFYSVSTYYISMSIFLAYAATFPDMRVLLMFIIPIRVKILGIIDAAYMGILIVWSVLDGSWYEAVIIVMSLLNFLIFFLSTRDLFGKHRFSTMKRKHDFERSIRWSQVNTGHATQNAGKTVITRHKCAICGRTELDGDIEFRFCTKCDGNYEYCMDHLYTHEYVKRI